jgi:carboxypeptidase family protein
LINSLGVTTATAIAVVSLLLCACDGGRNVASPSATNAPSTTVQTYNVAGVVRQSTPGPNGVPDVRVEVIDESNAGQFTMSDADGRYALSALAAGTLRLRASRSGYASAEQAIALSSHTTVDFTIVPGSACALSGMVQESPGNAPSVGAVVAFVKEPGGPSARVIVSSTTNATGTYQLGGIDCGVSRILRVTKPDFFSHEEYALPAGDARRDVTIERVAYPLEGFVRESPSGSPLVYATVEVVSGPYAGQKSTTRVDGSYFLQVRDTLTVRASKPGYGSQDATVTVAAPATYKDFSLTRAGL